MKKRLIITTLIITSLLFTSINLTQSKKVNNSTNNLLETTSEQLQETFNENTNSIIIDLRTYEEYYNGHIPNAETIPFGKYQNNIAEKLFRFRNKHIILYSEQQDISQQVSNILQKNGYNTISILVGGFQSWEEQGYQIIHEEACCRFIGNYPVMEELPPIPEYLESHMVDTSSMRITAGSLPSEFSWKDNDGQDWTTPARDQGSCGSCWAFSAIGAMESAINIASDSPDTDIDLSEQYLLSCLPSAGNCVNGGYARSALFYIKDESQNGNNINGVCTETCMPYTGTDITPCSSKCDNWDYHTNPPASDNILWQLEDFYFSNFNKDSPSDRAIIKQWLTTKGPLCVSLYVTDAFAMWGESNHDPEDYFKGSGVEKDSNHAVLLVGYKDDPGYWICKNSWGTSWGYQGFFNIQYGALNIDDEATWCTTPIWEDPIDPETTYINLTSPNGGETFMEGSYHNITWTSKNLTGDAEIEYSTDGGTSYPNLVDVVPVTDNLYVWKIPDENSVNCRLRIRSVQHRSIYDESNEIFTIIPFDGSLTLIEPNGGEQLIEGQIQNITWTSRNLADEINIYYSTNGNEWFPEYIATVSVLLGQYQWIVPHENSINCYIKIIHVHYESMNDISDSNFTITELFTPLNISIPGLRHCSVAWGDYDNDNDLDIAIAGETNNQFYTAIYQNRNNTFNKTEIQLTNIAHCSLAWGDYDNDGDLDLAIAGDTGTSCITKIYKNNGGNNFQEAPQILIGVRDCSLAWGDYDNDGDQDLAIAGSTGTKCITEIYTNNNGILQLLKTEITGVKEGCLAWGDYDNDNDLDILISGLDDNNKYTTKIYNNHQNNFTETDIKIEKTYASSAQWADYDNDGDLDLAISGKKDIMTPKNQITRKQTINPLGLGLIQLIKNFIQKIIDQIKQIFSGGNNNQDNQYPYFTKIYNNNQGTLEPINTNIIGIWRGCIKWADHDNDNKLELTISGRSIDRPITKVYYNHNGGFTDSKIQLPGVYDCCMDWGDYDNDGDQDLLISGYTGEQCLTRIYKNNR